MTIYGDFAQLQRSAIVSLNIGNCPSPEVADRLWQEYAVAVRPGIHCAPRLHQALQTAQSGTVRFSFSPFNTVEEIDLAAQAVKNLATQLNSQEE